MSSPDRAEQEYRAALTGGRLDQLDLALLDRTGVANVAVVWTTDDGRRNATGYGVTPQQALVGALGELSEGVFSDAAVADLDVIEASFDQLVEQRGRNAVVDPLELVLAAGSDYAPDHPLIWVEATRLRTGEPVLVPVEFAASKPGALARFGDRDWLITPISNGLGAGVSMEQAVTHGLLELLQRDGDTVSFRALDAGVVLDTDSLHDPVLDGLLADLRAVGIDATVKVAADEFVPVLYCVGDDRDARLSPPIALSAIGEAAHPDAAEAARKAVLEFAASRSRRIAAFADLEVLRPHYPDYVAETIAAGIPGAQEPRALAEMMAWCRMGHAELRAVLDPIFRERTVVGAGDLTSASADVGEMLPYLLDRLSDFDVLVVPGLAPTGSAVRTAKVIVPRLEVETVSYERIGERVARRLLDRADESGDSSGAGGGAIGGDLVAREPGPERARIRLTAEAEERLGGPVWLDRAQLAAALGALYPLYREPSWHAAPMSL